MSNPSRGSTRILLFVALLVVAGPALPAQSVTTPMAQFGHNIGDDYWLATYTELTAYWQVLATESPRMVLDTIGYTAEGRPHLMAIITSPANHANLAQHKRNARRLALANDLSDDEARELSQTAKAVVWIDGGLHATEVLGAAQLMEMAYQMVSLQDAESLRFLDDAITLLVHANPDGMELVSSWYMREPDPMQRSTGGIPRLYQKYVGHDNNRDSYMVTQPETENISRIMFRDWYPQIMYNHHQTGPSGTVLFAPPFRDPPNHNVHPLVTLGIQAVGTAMHQRLVSEGKPGSTMRQGANYSAWFNGNLRTTSYFHNMIGILTETQGNPTPMRIQFVPDRLIAVNDLPAPIEPQEWHFRQSVDYSITNNRAILDYASRYRENLLYNRYLMGKAAIERGSEDSWTIKPKLVAAVSAELNASGGRGGFGRGGLPPEGFQRFRDPDMRDPRGYILPSDQPDFPTAVKFVNTLERNGVAVHKATTAFTVAGKRYPANSLIVRADQAYAPHVYDMFEPQDHPNDFEYEGGPPVPPYDNAGYTLALQMGVQFDRILDGFDGPFELVQGFSAPPPGTVTNISGAAGFLVNHAVNDAAIATNRLLAADQEVYWISDAVTVAGQTWPAGTLWVPANATSRSMVVDMASELGLDFVGGASTPSVDALKLSPVTMGLWDQYGGSMSSGWTRWMFEQYEFPYEVVYPATLNEAGLEDTYDVLVFEDGAIPGGGGFGRFGGRNPSNIPAEYQAMLGRVTVEETVPNLIEYVRGGGTLLAIGSSTSIATHADLPMTNHLTDGAGDPLARAEYYVPSSVLEMAVDNTHPLGFGFSDHTNIMFNNSPVFRLLPQAASQGVTPVAWFDSETPLRSGWAWGEHQLFGGTTVAEVRLGEGRLFLFGPLIKKRAQPHATFKFLFNGIHLGGATPVRLGGVAQ